jgi:hypothetical protein
MVSSEELEGFMNLEEEGEEKQDTLIEMIKEKE